jgi:dCTP diphosphatase
MATLDIGAIQRALRDFARERDWDQFHTPKNLVMAMAGEVGELTEIFQWLTAAESRRVMDDPRRAEAVRDEVADVLNYLLRLADLLDLDLEAASLAKIGKNAEKYPADRVRGSAAKYSELDD